MLLSDTTNDRDADRHRGTRRVVAAGFALLHAGCGADPLGSWIDAPIDPFAYDAGGAYRPEDWRGGGVTTVGDDRVCTGNPAVSFPFDDGPEGLVVSDRWSTETTTSPAVDSSHHSAFDRAVGSPTGGSLALWLGGELPFARAIVVLPEARLVRCLTLRFQIAAQSDQWFGSDPARGFGRRVVARAVSVPGNVRVALGAAGCEASWDSRESPPVGLGLTGFWAGTWYELTIDVVRLRGCQFDQVPVHELALTWSPRKEPSGAIPPTATPSFTSTA